MTDDRPIEILKSAILLEKRGMAFYAATAGQTSSRAVKEFFEMMADEEARHAEILSEQFRAYRRNKEFSPENNLEDRSGIAAQVLTKELKEYISAADFEAAAISAAMAMEKDAIRLYSGRAAEADDPNEKALYGWLADWEAQHLDFLAALDRELTEKIWFDNNFWPF